MSNIICTVDINTWLDSIWNQSTESADETIEASGTDCDLRWNNNKKATYKQYWNLFIKCNLRAESHQACVLKELQMKKKKKKKKKM